MGAWLNPLKASALVYPTGQADGKKWRCHNRRAQIKGTNAPSIDKLAPVM